jgi:hypothetical protein
VSFFAILIVPRASKSSFHISFVLTFSARAHRRACDLIRTIPRCESSIEVDTLNQLGFKHTFSVECPYGTENERAVRFALERYQLARNRMPDAFVEDIDRFSDTDPTSSEKQYVRWQRGALTETSTGVMKSWVDVTASHDSIWLVLAFHGVDGIGWKPKTGLELKEG